MACSQNLIFLASVFIKERDIGVTVADNLRPADQCIRAAKDSPRANIEGLALPGKTCICKIVQASK
jgi:hypothetical protein